MFTPLTLVFCLFVFLLSVYPTSKSTMDDDELDGKGIVVMLLMKLPKSSRVFSLQSPEKAHKMQNIR